MPARLARDASEALTAAEGLGFPVAVKAMGLRHKSDAGGVVLDVADPQGAAVALDARLVLATPAAVE